MMSPRSVSEDENERCVRSLRTWKSARRLGVVILTHDAVRRVSNLVTQRSCTTNLCLFV